MQNPYEFSAIIDLHSPSKVEADGNMDAFRKGELLFFRDGSKLPPYCLWTNEQATRWVEVEQGWQPRWIYLFLVLGIVPYFFVSPFFHRRLKFRVPMGQSKYSSAMRFVWLGLWLLIIGVATIGIGIIGSSILFARFGLGEFLLICWLGFVAAVLGFNIAAIPIGVLRIVQIENGLFVVRGVHPDFLNRLPKDNCD